MSGILRYLRFLLCYPGLAVMLLASGGCSSSGPETAHVSGRVTMDGKPLANATVVFIPEDGRPAGARTDANGNYVLNFTERRRGAIPGKSNVRITTQREAEHDENGKVVMRASPETIPMEYNAASTLEFTVEPKKKNVANFELKSGGKVLSSE
jgi:hypothetical protein